MNPFSFHMPVALQYGEGSLKTCAERLSPFGNRCLVLISGHAAQQSGALDDALASLKAAGVEATVFPYISQNPTIGECRAAADAAGAAGAKFLLGIGGGSVMDATKATAWMATNLVIDPEKVFGGSLRRDPLPFALCGTTAGTGSEVSAVAVITDDNGRKRSIKNPHCYADVVFADPRYTDTLPRAATESTALDALCHAAEGFLNPACDDISTLCARQALPRIAEGLLWLCRQEGLPDKALRDTLFDGALWAGLVLNTCGTAFPHPMGYVLTEDFGIPHGRACAVFLPALLTCAEQHAPQRTEELYALCGGKEALTAILDTLAKPAVTMTEEQVAAYAKRWENLPHYRRVPGGYDVQQAAALCRRLFGGAEL